MLVIDPQGEFSQDMKPGGTSGEFALPVGDVVKKFGKRPVVLTVRNLVFDRWDLFEEIRFESLFFERWTVPKGENRWLALGILVDRLQKTKVKPMNLHQRASFDKAWSVLLGKKVGQEFQALRQLVGSSGTALDLYQLFRDPHSAFDVASRQIQLHNHRPGQPFVVFGNAALPKRFQSTRRFFAE